MLSWLPWCKAMSLSNWSSRKMHETLPSFNWFLTCPYFCKWLSHSLTRLRRHMRDTCLWIPPCLDPFAVIDFRTGWCLIFNVFLALSAWSGTLLTHCDTSLWLCSLVSSLLVDSFNRIPPFMLCILFGLVLVTQSILSQPRVERVTESDSLEFSSPCRIF